MNLIILEDDLSVAKIITKFLNVLHYRCILCHDGKDVIEIVRYYARIKHPFDLGLFDLIIPGGMGGIETLEHIHAFLPEFHAIAMSGNLDDPCMNCPQSYGFLRQLFKPFSLSAFQTTIKQYEK